jgi:hypothetical protein
MPKMRELLRILRLVIAMLIIPGTALAWGRGGHRAVCLTAWGELSAPTRAAVLDLLGITTPEQFADSCYWADEVRPQRPLTGPWHYINIPKDARAIDLERDCPLPASCIVREIDRHAATLKDAASKTERAEALKFLAHFVGDLHQPLHVGFAEDRGGNEISLTFLGRRTNMHALWDWGLLEAPAPPPDLSYPHVKAALHRLARSRWKAGTPADWAQETLWLMRAPATGYVGNPGGLEFGDVYVAQNYPVAGAQVEKAGVRLAYLLEDVLK